MFDRVIIYYSKCLICAFLLAFPLLSDAQIGNVEFREKNFEGREAEFKKAFDHFVDIRTLNDVEAATRINQDGIDVLIDLTGYTQSSRTGITVLKPSPIQINWLGFAGTMGDINGEPLFDYMLADHIIAPNEKDFSEQVLYLPCYQPNNKRIIAKTSEKSDHNLPKDSFVYCCFNQTFKI